MSINRNNKVEILFLFLYFFGLQENGTKQKINIHNNVEINGEGLAKNKNTIKAKIIPSLVSKRSINQAIKKKTKMQVFIFIYFLQFLCAFVCFTVLFCPIVCFSVLFCAFLCFSVLFCPIVCFSVLFCAIVCFS